MKHVILHYCFILYLCNIKMCATTRRHRFRRGHYDINGFISQLLASSKFDELAEKLAEKAASKIMHMNEGQAPVDRANDANEVQNNTESITQSTPTQFEEKHVNNHGVHLRKGFAGKIDPQAVMNETISLSDNLILKYKLLKKNALESKLMKQRDMVSKNVPNEVRKENKTTGPADDANKKTVGQTSNQKATQHIKEDVKNKLYDENKSVRDNDQMEEHKRNSERNSFHSGTDGELNEAGQKNDHHHQPKELSPIQDDREKKFRVEQNSGAEVEEQKARQVANGIKEEIPSSLDEQNRNYSPSEENTNAEPKLERIEDEPQKRGTEDSIEVGPALPYFRGREDSAEVNIVPSRSDAPNPYGGIDRSVGSNDSGATGGLGSHEKFPEDQTSTEKANEDPAKPVIRREGDKIYTYNQAPEYQDFHEEMAKWQKEHPENPADFL